MRPLEMVSKFKILPRDLRLLKTRGANIAVRPDYFLFRLPPFTGCVRRDSCLLLTDGPSAATDVLQDSLLSQIKLPTEEDQLQTTPFELRVLETALREDLLSKQERFTPNPNPNPDPNPDANPEPDPDPNRNRNRNPRPSPSPNPNPKRRDSERSRAETEAEPAGGGVNKDGSHLAEQAGGQPGR